MPARPRHTTTRFGASARSRRIPRRTWFVLGKATTWWSRFTAAEYSLPLKRFRTLYHASTNRFSELGFTGLFGARISEWEAQGLLNGKLPDGNEVPVFSFGEFENGISDLPRRYAVVLDFETAKTSNNGNAPFDDAQG